MNFNHINELEVAVESSKPFLNEEEETWGQACECNFVGKKNNYWEVSASSG